MSPKLIKSKRYENLFRDEASGIFQFRKYSSIRRKEFFRSTGEKDNEARAYKIGLDAFNDWLGKVTDETGVVYFGRFAKRYLNLKLDDPSLSDGTKREFRNQVESSPRPGAGPMEIRPRLIDAFGHFPIERLNNELWTKWTREILSRQEGFKFFNARKVLLEILRNAHECGYLERIPKLDNPDTDAAPAHELTRMELRKLFAAAHYIELVKGPNRTTVVRRRENGTPVRIKNWIKLLMFIMWKQGARPGEVLKYRWDMIHWDEGPHGSLHVPAAITKTRRARVLSLNSSVSHVLRFLKGSATSPFLFPSPEGSGEAPIAFYNKTWAGVCRRSGLSAQLYWFRDTFVTERIREGKRPLHIAKYIDSSVVMLERKYAAASGQDSAEVAG